MANTSQGCVDTIRITHGVERKNCPGEAVPEKGSNSNASDVSLVIGEDDLL